MFWNNIPFIGGMLIDEWLISGHILIGIQDNSHLELLFINLNGKLNNYKVYLNDEYVLEGLLTITYWLMEQKYIYGDPTTTILG